MRRFLRFQNLIFWDYALAQVIVPWAAGLGILAYFIFHFYEGSLGYADYWPVRIALMIYLAPLILFSRKKPFAAWQAVYWEVAVLLSLPFMQTYLFLINKPDDYWKASLLFEGIVLGLLAKPLWAPVSLIAGTALGIAVYECQHTFSKGSIDIVFETLPLVFLLGLFGTLVRVAFDVFHHRGVRLSEERLQRETAQRDAALAQAAAESEKLRTAAAQQETELAQQAAVAEKLRAEAAESARALAETKAEMAHLAVEQALREAELAQRESALHKQHMEEAKQALEEIKKREECIIRYVRPSIVEEIRNNGKPLEFEPVLRDVAIMFCDIREFTQLTEVLSHLDKLNYLNSYFSKMTAPIVRHKGEVDKIMGDAVMGIFDNGADAVLAAIEMRKALQDYNREMLKVGRVKIRNGIGISKGEVIWGNFGSAEKLDRTVIGEPVNIAARLESKTKMYSLEIVVSEAVVKDLDGPFHYRWIDNAQMKGSSRQLKLYEIYDHQHPDVVKFKDGTNDIMEKALTIYFQKGFNDAMRLFTSLKERAPQHLYVEGEGMDGLLDYYIRRCREWLDNPDAWELMQQWEGCHVFQEK